MASEMYDNILKNSSEKYMFPALRGVQAGREYYIAMCPMRVIPRVFLFDEEELPPELRAQRTLNKSRIPEMSRYLTEDPEDYVFSSITASIDGVTKFIPFGSDGAESKMGQLIIPMSARVLINDGQHRRAAIEMAIAENPEIANEAISVVFFIDAGLKRSQQMFADLNQHAVRASKSLEILYDHKNELALLVKDIVKEVPVFKDKTETEKTSISNRSIKVFTLSNIYHATRALLGKTSKRFEVTEEDKKISVEFWKEVAKNIPEWQLLEENKISSHELRRDYVHAHGVTLQAIGDMGLSLIESHPKGWKKKLKLLNKIDWSRLNSDMWEGRIMHQGKIRKTRNNILLTSNILKKKLGLGLGEKELEIENQFSSP